MKIQYRYFFLFILLLLIEIGIAVFIQDSFIRPYFGDALVVVLLYFFFRSFYYHPYLPIWIFAFACMIEGLQYMQILSFLNLQQIDFLRILLGGTFDWLDILCYAVGTCFNTVWQRIEERR